MLESSRKRGHRQRRRIGCEDRVCADDDLERGEQLALDVEVLDDLSTGHEANLAGALAAGAVLHRVDVRDAAAVDAAIRSAAPRVVFHLAAQIDVRRSVADWLAFMQLRDAGKMSQLDRYIGYWEPYATSHEALDRDEAVQEEVRNAARALARQVRLAREGKLADPEEGLVPPRPK